jgi:hypothetical protein
MEMEAALSVTEKLKDEGNWGVGLCGFEGEDCGEVAAAEKKHGELTIENTCIVAHRLTLFDLIE